MNRFFLLYVLALTLILGGFPTTASPNHDDIPVPAAWAPPGKADLKRGKTLYHQYCRFCHGTHGNGKGPSGKSLPVNPADFTNVDFMSIEPDKELFVAISRGAAAVGESPFMPAFGYTLSTADIQNVQAYIRKAFCGGCQYDPSRAAEHEQHEKEEHDPHKP